MLNQKLWRGIDMNLKQNVSWLHISDLHFGQPEEGYDKEYQNMIMNALLEDVDELRQQSNLTPVLLKN